MEAWLLEASAGNEEACNTLFSKVAVEEVEGAKDELLALSVGRKRNSLQAGREFLKSGEERDDVDEEESWLILVDPLHVCEYDKEDFSVVLC